MPSREEMWNRIKNKTDVLVIGGGATGAGIAREASRRGLDVTLVEMGDFASGTSSRSSKLVHGGLRYLEHYEFSLVFEAVSERRILLDIAPHLVNPLGFLFPVYRTSKRKLWFINAGMWLYDGLSLFRSPKIHRTLTPKEVGKEEPALKRSGLTGCPLYYDCATDDARITLESIIDAAFAGAAVCNWVRATRLTKDTKGRVNGIIARDGFTGEEKAIEAGVVINATGPWTDRTRKMSENGSKGQLLRPTKGVHIVVERSKLPTQHAVVCSHPVDNRVLFAIPWGERTYIGTTDTDYEGDPAEVHATLEDVDYLLEASKAYFPDHPLVRDDVVSTWAGLRPLIHALGVEDDVHESKVSREHEIIVGKDGLLTIAGGKLTTFRRMGEETMDVATKLLRLMDVLPPGLEPANTDTEPLPGALGWPEDDDHDKVAALVEGASDGQLSLEVARYLGDTYGMRAIDLAGLVASEPLLATPLIPGRREILAQVDWAVEYEMAATVCDVLIRRTQVYFRDLDQGLSAAPKVAERMKLLLGKDEDWVQAQVAAYGKEVGLSRRWREECAS